MTTHLLHTVATFLKARASGVQLDTRLWAARVAWLTRLNRLADAAQACDLLFRRMAQDLQHATHQREEPPVQTSATAPAALASAPALMPVAADVSSFADQLRLQGLFVDLESDHASLPPLPPLLSTVDVGASTDAAAVADLLGPQAFNVHDDLTLSNGTQTIPKDTVAPLSRAFIDSRHPPRIDRMVADAHAAVTALFEAYLARYICLFVVCSYARACLRVFSEHMHAYLSSN